MCRHGRGRDGDDIVTEGRSYAVVEAVPGGVESLEAEINGAARERMTIGRDHFWPLRHGGIRETRASRHRKHGRIVRAGIGISVVDWEVDHLDRSTSQNARLVKTSGIAALFVQLIYVGDIDVGVVEPLAAGGSIWKARLCRVRH